MPWVLDESVCKWPEFLWDSRKWLTSEYTVHSPKFIEEPLEK